MLLQDNMKYIIYLIFILLPILSHCEQDLPYLIEFEFEGHKYLAIDFEHSPDCDCKNNKRP
jgi:hypothetical protein